MVSMPIIQSAVKERMIVAAIDFGTTYSGYAFALRHEFNADPLKATANQWNVGSRSSVSLKTPTCILFSPDKKYDSFGYEAEDKYANLALDDHHHDWYYFRRFKMSLYENRVSIFVIDVVTVKERLKRFIDSFICFVFFFVKNARLGNLIT